MKQLSVFIFLSIIVFSCKPAKDKKTADPSYIPAIDEWHNKRVERLKSTTGWLSLVGLHWLKDGEINSAAILPINLFFRKKLLRFADRFFCKMEKLAWT